MKKTMKGKMPVAPSDDSKHMELPPALRPDTNRNHVSSVRHDDDDDDDGDEDTPIDDLPPKPSVDPIPPDAFERSPFRSREDRNRNLYSAKVIPVWCEWVCTTSNEVRVLAQIVYAFREGGSRLYRVGGYKVVYYRIKKLVAELPPMSFKQVRTALDGLIGRGILVEMGWRENNRMLRISSPRVEELVAEWEAEHGSSK